MKKQILDLSKKLISIRSTEENIEKQKECLDLLEKKFKGVFKISKYNLKGHPALVFSTTNKKKVDIIFSGHIDVVKGSEELFKPKEQAGKLYGRGAYDMKAGLVACLYAATEYKKRGGKKEIAILITSDEEKSGYGTYALLKDKGYHADFAFIADGGGGNQIVNKQKGFIQFKVTLPGKSCHSSQVWKGENPIPKLLVLQNKLSEMFPGPTFKDQWKTSVVLTKVSTDNSLNQIPEYAEGYFDIRFTKNEDLKNIKKELNKFVGKKGEVEVVSENDLFFTNENELWLQVLKKVLQKKLRKKMIFKHENGTSDAVFFTEHGIPAVLWRPDGVGAHQNEEWVDMDSVYFLYESLIDLLNFDTNKGY